jgi:hypothetical protein
MLSLCIAPWLYIVFLLFILFQDVSLATGGATTDVAGNVDQVSKPSEKWIWSYPFLIIHTFILWLVTKRGSDCVIINPLLLGCLTRRDKTYTERLLQLQLQDCRAISSNAENHPRIAHWLTIDDIRIAFSIRFNARNVWMLFGMYQVVARGTCNKFITLIFAIPGCSHGWVWKYYGRGYRCVRSRLIIVQSILAVCTFSPFFALSLNMFVNQQLN